MCLYPIASFHTCNKFSSTHQSFLAAVQSQVEPTKLSETVKHSKYRSAMNDEIDALENNGTWPLTSLPLGRISNGNGFIISNLRPMDPLNDINSMQLFLVILKLRDIILFRHLLRMLSLLPFTPCLHQLLLRVGKFIKWMFTMSSSMVTYLKKFT